ncbi:MAG: carboxypeptidase-like regulatory domain-containing protein [Acidimicrobiia bacterium]|nr:carboxypeptidase-like regulatory domain-containing protein [Acidimicrobiia bacterium]
MNNSAGYRGWNNYNLPSSFTDANGNYSVAVPNDILVDVHVAEKINNQNYGSLLEFEVHPASTVNFTMSPAGGTLQGVVRTPGGAPAAGVKVEAIGVRNGPPFGWGDTVTAGDGSYRIPRLREGEYRVFVSSLGYDTGQLPLIPAGPGRITTLDLPGSTFSIALESNVPASCGTASAQLSVGTAAIDTSPAAFVPLTPTRIHDTRDQGDVGYICPGTSRDFQVTGLGGVPGSGASAVVLNVTATDTEPGFLTVYPSGEGRPVASNLNIASRSQIRPNLVIVPVGNGGKVSIFSQRGAHVVLDVAGYFTPSASGNGGRYTPINPSRAVDTRPGGIKITGPIQRQIAATPGVPASGVSAVALNVTVTESDAPGFVTVWPTGKSQPVASNLNMAGAGDTNANLVIVPVGPDGAIQLATQGGAHLIVDVVGWFNDNSAAPTSAGLFVPLTPKRVFDTRDGGTPVGAQSELVRSHTNGTGVPGSARAAALNVTAVDASAAGYLRVWPTGAPEPGTSTVNFAAGDIRPNAALAQLNGGNASYSSNVALHVVADVSGYFTS